MKKWLIILLNIVLCIAHGLCLVFLESFMSVPLIWSDVGFSLNASILGCVLLDLVVHYLVFIQMSKRGGTCKFTLSALRCIDYVLCGFFLPAVDWLIPVHDEPLDSLPASCFCCRDERHSHIGAEIYLPGGHKEDLETEVREW